jgi:hypothetical protein
MGFAPEDPIQEKIVKLFALLGQFQLRSLQNIHSHNTFYYFPFIMPYIQIQLDSVGAQLLQCCLIQVGHIWPNASPVNLQQGMRLAAIYAMLQHIRRARLHAARLLPMAGRVFKANVL